MLRIAAAVAAITIIAATPAEAATYLHDEQPDYAQRSAQDLHKYASLTDADVAPMARLTDLGSTEMVDTWSPALVFFADRSRTQGQAARVTGAVRDQRRYISNFRIPARQHGPAADRPTQQRVAALDILTLSAVPEPHSWTLMIAGFGMIGAMLRRRRPNAIKA